MLRTPVAGLLCRVAGPPVRPSSLAYQGHSCNTHLGSDGGLAATQLAAKLLLQLLTQLSFCRASSGMGKLGVAQTLVTALNPDDSCNHARHAPDRSELRGQGLPLRSPCCLCRKELWVSPAAKLHCPRPSQRSSKPQVALTCSNDKQCRSFASCWKPGRWCRGTGSPVTMDMSAF